MIFVTSQKMRYYSLLAVLAFFSLVGPHNAEAQSRGKLAYDSSEDAGFLTLWNRRDGRTARLFVAGSNDEAGELLLYDNDDIRIRLGVDEESQGRLILLGSEGQDSARIGVSDSNDEGLAWLYNDEGVIKARLEVVEDAGRLQLFSTFCKVVPPPSEPLPANPADDAAKTPRNPCADETRKIVTAERISSDAPDHGRVRVWASDNVRAELKADANTGAGKLVLWNSDGNATITLDGETGTITVNGTVLTANTLGSAMVLAGGQMQSPVPPLIVRGSAKLADGKARIALPARFSKLGNLDKLTVQLTPNSADTFGLAAVSKTLDAVEVAELRNGRGDFGFDYVISTEPSDPVLSPAITQASQANGTAVTRWPAGE